jgi:hypothetical protein
MRLLLIAATLLFAASAKLQATEALMFDGGGYTLYVLVGDAEKPVVAQVRLTVPGAKDWVHVPREQLQVEKFDEHAQVLVMRFTNKNDAEAPPSFSFSAKKKKGVLTIKGKTITGSFDWLEE